MASAPSSSPIKNYFGELFWKHVSDAHWTLKKSILRWSTAFLKILMFKYGPLLSVSQERTYCGLAKLTSWFLFQRHNTFQIFRFCCLQNEKENTRCVHHKNFYPENIFIVSAPPPLMCANLHSLFCFRVTTTVEGKLCKLFS